jgi:hypothetical protein
MPNEYEAALLELGATPVSALDKTLWGDETGRTLFLKGQRVDINGWVAPHWTKEGTFAPGPEKERAVASLTFAQYVSLLDVESYAARKDPLQYAAMAIALDRMLMDGTRIENPEAIIRVYEAGIGLEDRALRLLRDCITSEQAMPLYEKHPDSRLLDVFPAPHPEDVRYVQFLREVADRDTEKGWLAFRLLHAMDQTVYREQFRDFLIDRIRDTASWATRSRMCEALAGIGDQVSMDFLGNYLSAEPITEVREAILRAALSHGRCPSNFVGSIAQFAGDLDRGHRSVTSGRMADQWKYSLREYLTWAENSDLCDAASQVEARSALDRLK